MSILNHAHTFNSWCALQVKRRRGRSDEGPQVEVPSCPETTETVHSTGREGNTVFICEPWINLLEERYLLPYWLGIWVAQHTFLGHTIDASTRGVASAIVS
eukprot:1183834-Prorocentrum_minimum.AAC.3